MYRFLIEFSVDVDVDECTTSDHDCDENAICENLIGGPGSFSCSCKDGYHGDGKTCLDETIGNNYKI